MPTPAKTSQAALAAIARELVEASGPDALTVGAVAQRAGIKPPSLYKHFVDRSALLKAVEIDVLHELEAHLRRETKGADHKSRLKAMARAYRRFGTTAPNRYRVIYSGNAFIDPEIREACLYSAQPLFEELRAAGIAEQRILPVSRTLVPFLHGFVIMEIGSAFNLGGDIEEAFETGLETILAGV
ncbi:TetR/AcrR family transcriptional regulator [Devosia sp. ZB163]|uniref:TetR/AcrR family transcriptional regulator n=1 Tax=Devosia sp. ZB163 TaxID=3025938 RepID=UPI00235EB545|nr:TetR/AcrR family transcriptional regulator [Devosia sp. ZB163]MDC9823860.1 TetR/AcrR family transcriptional regulator [Devosia sp. ZB163]